MTVAILPDVVVELFWRLHMALREFENFRVFKSRKGGLRQRGYTLKKGEKNPRASKLWDEGFRMGATAWPVAVS